MLTLSRWNALWQQSKFHPIRTKMASPDWPGNKDLKTRNSLVHSLLVFYKRNKEMNQQLRGDYYCVTEWNATSETMHALSRQWGIDQIRPYSAEGKLILFDKLT